MKQFNNIWKFIAGGGTVLGYQAFYARMTDKNNAELKESIKSVNDKLDGIVNKVNESNHELAETKNSISEAKASLQNILDIQEKYNVKHDAIAKDDTESSHSLFHEYADEIIKAFDKCKKITEKVNDSYNDTTHNIVENNVFKDLIDNFNAYISSLSNSELCLVINITSSIFILTCIFSIIFAVTGNYFISRLNLESKYPKLASFISIRVKLQNAYIVTNSLLILVAVVLMIIINAITLISY